MKASDSWLATITISFAGFIFVTSEFLPIGLLRDLGAAFHRTDSATGLLMTSYAWLVAILSIPLTAITSKFNRRTLTLSLVACFALGQILCAFSFSFETLLIARLVVASVHAIFWAIAVPLAIKVAPTGKRQVALSLVITGVTMGTVLGVPLSTFLGQLISWRFAFFAIGILGFITLAALWKMLPSDLNESSGKQPNMMSLFGRRNLLLCYLMTLIFVTAHFTVYTYIRPIVQTLGSVRREMISPIILVFGVAGLVGSLIAPQALRRSFNLTAFIAIVLTASSLLLLPLLSNTYFGVFTIMFVWGIAMTIFVLILQNLVLGFAPDSADLAMAGHGAIFNVGIGSGSLIGGYMVDNYLDKIGLLGCVLALISIAICVLLLKRAPTSIVGSTTGMH